MYKYIGINEYKSLNIPIAKLEILLITVQSNIASIECDL